MEETQGVDWNGKIQWGEGWKRVVRKGIQGGKTNSKGLFKWAWGNLILWKLLKTYT